MRYRHLVTSIFSALMFISFVSPSSSGQIRSDTPPRGAVYIISDMAPFGIWDQPGYPEKYERGAELSTYKPEWGKRDQQYVFLADGDGWYHIATNNGKGAVTLKGNKNNNGVHLVVWDYDVAAANQKFLVQHQGNGKFKIFTAYGRCVTVANRSCENGSAIQTWDNHDGAWMLWQFKMVEGGKLYNPDENKNANSSSDSSAGSAKKYGTLKDALAGPKIGQQYFDRVSISDFESENSGKLLQTWMEGLSRNDQMTAYNDILSDAALAPAAESIFKALSEVTPKSGKGFSDNMAKNLMRKQYTDAANRQKNAGVRAQMQAVAAKLK